MDTVDVFVDVDVVDIVGVHCDMCINEINIMSQHFDSIKEELFERDGVYKMKVVFHPAEYEGGGLVNGSWYDFLPVSYKVLGEDL